jgi:glycine/D-amino acid oxidase-like deaminating enzyme
VDAAVVGGGIAGIVTAYFLMQQGLKVAVVEALRIIEDVTGYTTGKLTYQHGRLYSRLTGTLGADKAQVYADANTASLGRLAAIIESNKIDCDFRRADSYLYTELDTNVDTVRTEVEIARRLGLPASFAGETPMPFVRAAMRFDNQAQFHPRKFLLFLAREIVASGGFFWENTRALDIVEGGVAAGSGGLPGRAGGSRGVNKKEVILKTDRGDIRAASVIVATNIPFYRRELFTPLFTPTRSFVLGLRLDGPTPEGLYYCIDPYGGSIRNQPVADGTLLMVGCWNKQLGNTEISRQYEEVESYARARLPVRSIDYHWFTQDQKTPDRAPCIGRMPGSKRVFMAAGFGGWGMTTSGVAAMILSDLVTGRKNPWAALFDPARIIGS